MLCSCGSSPAIETDYRGDHARHRHTPASFIRTAREGRLQHPPRFLLPWVGYARDPVAKWYLLRRSAIRRLLRIHGRRYAISTPSRLRIVKTRSNFCLYFLMEVVRAPYHSSRVSKGFPEICGACLPEMNHWDRPRQIAGVRVARGRVAPRAAAPFAYGKRGRGSASSVDATLRDPAA